MAKIAPLPADAGQVVAASHNGRVVGWSLSETAGAVARIRLWSGVSAGTETTSENLVADISLSANGTAQFAAPSNVSYRQFIGGLYLEIVAGSMAGEVLWI